MICDPHLFIRKVGPTSLSPTLERFYALQFSFSATTFNLDIQYSIRKLINAPSNPYPSSTMPPKKTTTAKPAKTAAAAPHASYKGMLNPGFALHHAVASLQPWVYFGRVPLLTCSTRHDQGSYHGCESTLPGAFGLAARYMLRTMRPQDMPTTTHPATT